MTVTLERRASAFDRGAGLTVRHRRFASPLEYGQTVMPRIVRTPALEIVNGALVDVLEGRCERLMVWLAPQEGKGLPLDTPIATPAGWTTMGALAPGDVIYGGDGQECAVTAAFEPRNLDCYRITFRDHTTLTADGDHLWKAQDRRSGRGGGRGRPWRVVSTRDLAADPSRWGVPLSPVLECKPREDLPLPPYILGAWLGDGTAMNAGFTCADQEIRDELAVEGWPVRRVAPNHPYTWTWAADRSDPTAARGVFVGHLRALGVLGNKHIPNSYLRGSTEQRLGLMQGLMDTDGSCYTTGTAYAKCEFATTSERLAWDVFSLAKSLGICARLETRRAVLNGRDIGPAWRVKFTTDLPVFRLPRKLARLHASPPRKARHMIGIISVEPVPSVTTRCITVDSQDRTFLAGRQLVPTHNSTLTTRCTIGTALSWQPEQRWGIASYSDRLARGWSRRIRNDITGNNGRRGAVDLGLRLAPDQRASDEWRLDNGIGGVYAAGIGGSWSGMPLDGLVVDDPHKDRKAANSNVLRADVIDWWESAATARLAPGGPIILVLTRWHWDDLAGYLLRTQPDTWRVVHIPAQADPQLLAVDPLGREPGEFMVSARGRTREQWERRKMDAGDEWTPLYQGAPAAPGGTMFSTDHLRYWHFNDDRTELVMGPRSWRLRDCYVYVTVDTADSVKQSADFTVASCWAITPDGSLVLLDVMRDRVTEDGQLDLARPLVERWSPGLVWVESKLASTLLVREAVGEGWPIADLKPQGSKTMRAAPAARRVKLRRVWFPAEHRHLDTIVEELRQFPNGAHDDFVDTLAYAVIVEHDRFVPAGIGEPQVQPADGDPYEAVAGPPLDYENARW